MSRELALFPSRQDARPNPCHCLVLLIVLVPIPAVFYQINEVKRGKAISEGKLIFEAYMNEVFSKADTYSPDHFDTLLDDAQRQALKEYENNLPWYVIGKEIGESSLILYCSKSKEHLRRKNKSKSKDRKDRGVRQAKQKFIDFMNKVLGPSSSWTTEEFDQHLTQAEQEAIRFYEKYVPGYIPDRESGRAVVTAFCYQRKEKLKRESSNKLKVKQRCFSIQMKLKRGIHQAFQIFDDYMNKGKGIVRSLVPEIVMEYWTYFLE